MKKKIHVFFTVVLCLLFFIPILLYIVFSCYNTSRSYGRTYQATIDRVGWQVKFTEQNADTLLKFMFHQKGTHSPDSMSLSIHNGYMEDVVSFLFVEGIDTIYIRKSREYGDLFPPEKRKSNIMVSPGFTTKCPIEGKIPSRCTTVPFSDPGFFIYDKKKCTYVPKDERTHVVTLFHNTERTNTYYLFDMTKNDTIEVKLNITNE